MINEKIFRENPLEEIKGGLKKFLEKVPIFIKNKKEWVYFVEIILMHKQRAVGLQTMVYLCIYADKLKNRNGNSLIGRVATIRDSGRLEITTENKAFITNVVKAFAIASWQHKNDISNILEQIKRKCKL